MNKKVQVQDLGLRDYKDTWDYQEQLFKAILNTKIRNRREAAGMLTDNHFLFVEHPHVYTLGKSGDLDNLLLNEKQLKEKDISFYTLLFIIIYLFINDKSSIEYHLFYKT